MLRRVRAIVQFLLNGCTLELRAVFKLPDISLSTRGAEVCLGGSAEFIVLVQGARHAVGARIAQIPRGL